MQNLIFALILSVAALSFSHAETHSNLETRSHIEQLQSLQYEHATVHKVATEDGIQLNVAELLDENDQPMVDGEPILLVHGYTSNWNSFKHIADLYRSKGYRVFMANWRGHGQGRFRSVGDADPETDPRMIFENLPAYDVPALVNFVSKKADGRPIIYQGHSMGGMMAHLAFAGVTRNAEGDLVIDTKKAKRFEKKVKAFIPIASPLSLNALEVMGAQFLEPIITPIVNMLDKSDMDNSNNPLLNLPFGSLAYHIRLSLTYATMKRINLVTGLINVKNLSAEEFIEMHYLWGSKVPKIFARGIMQMNSTGYMSLNGKIDFQAISQSRPTTTEYYKTKIPTLLLSPEKDILAAVNEQKDLAAQRNIDYVEFKGVGHVDIIASKSLARRVASNTLVFSQLVDNQIALQMITKKSSTATCENTLARK